MAKNTVDTSKEAVDSALEEISKYADGRRKADAMQERIGFRVSEKLKEWLVKKGAEYDMGENAFSRHILSVAWQADKEGILKNLLELDPH